MCSTFSSNRGDDEEVHEVNRIDTLVDHHMEFLCNTKLKEEEFIDDVELESVQGVGT